MFPRELRAYRASRQSAGALAADAAALSRLHVAFALLGLLCLPWLAWWRRKHDAMSALATLTLLAAISNAILTGALSGPNERYQGRIAWLFVLVPLAVLVASRAARRMLDEEAQERIDSPASADAGGGRSRSMARPATSHLQVGAASTTSQSGGGRIPSGGMPGIVGGTMSGLQDVSLEAERLSRLNGRMPALVPFTRLVAARHSIAARYQASGPLAHVVLENLLDERVLNSLATPRAGSASRRVTGATTGERRRDKGDGAKLSPVGELLLQQLASEPFVEWLREVTGIDELVADPDLRDSGLREARTGSHLDLRIGATRHPHLPLIRRLVLVIYIEREWDASWGGTLDLRAPDAAAAEVVVPRFNRVVLLQTLPAETEARQDVLRCPSSASCRALSVTYWSPDPEARLAGADAGKMARARMRLRSLASSLAASIVGQIRAAVRRGG